jgi:hypothetical protein
MANDVDKELSKKYCPRFGKIAVEKGYVEVEQVKDALSEQLDDDLANRPHRLIGRIFLDKNLMTPQQIDEVLNEVFGMEDEE